MSDGTRTVKAPPPAPVRLTSILVASKLLRPEHARQLEEAAERDGLRLEAVLEREGVLTRVKQLQVLENHYFCPAMDVRGLEYDAAAAALLPERLARRHQALVVRIEGETVVVAFRTTRRRPGGGDRRAFPAAAPAARRRSGGRSRGRHRRALCAPHPGSRQRRADRRRGAPGGAAAVHGGRAVAGPGGGSAECRSPAVLPRSSRGRSRTELPGGLSRSRDRDASGLRLDREVDAPWTERGGDRGRVARHRLRATGHRHPRGAGEARPGGALAHRRHPAPGRLSPRSDLASGHVPAEGDGADGHRRAALAAGRALLPAAGGRGRGSAGLELAVPVRREDRHPPAREEHVAPGSRQPAHAAGGAGSAPGHDRRPDRLLPGHWSHRQRQDDHPLRDAERARPAVAQRDHPRGSHRIQLAGAHPGADQRNRRARPSRGCCSPSCGRTRT